MTEITSLTKSSRSMSQFLAFIGLPAKIINRRLKAFCHSKANYGAHTDSGSNRCSYRWS